MHPEWKCRYTMQRALLGHITPNLRSVRLRYFNEFVVLDFYYNITPSEEEQELVRLTFIDFNADFPSNNNNWNIITLPYPEKIPKEGDCVYLRYEE